MSDTSTDDLDEAVEEEQEDGGSTPAGDGEYVFDASHVKSHGVGMSLKALEEKKDDEDLQAAWSEFKDVVERHKTAVEAEAELRELRNATIRDLKDTHGVSFAAMAEVIGVTHSNVLYTYERSLGKTAKQIREEQKLSSAAKAVLRAGKTTKTTRKQTPAEKLFRKQQRDALRAFLEEQAREADGEDAATIQAGLNEIAAEEALDAAEDGED